MGFRTVVDSIPQWAVDYFVNAETGVIDELPDPPVDSLERMKSLL